MIQPTSRVIAVLGPTNTGKTHLALDRMLGHASGMIGFPLRLLARENYDRIAKLKGPGAVALLTGEEKIIPPHPRWFVCTVESMPLDRQVDFLAVDEIQLCADPDRGHVFTDRLLSARGRAETMFLGSETIKPLIRQLVANCEFISRPRFSQLSYSGQRKLTRLPSRSAIVAFSAQDVYSIAELVRRQRGGAAVVLGALSPRTRNAQVGLYQAGEVDYLVATDAIGMGLNMDVDHVAFAALRKFDGRSPRGLEAPEVAQIAGRAGRHMNDGTFGTTGDIGGIADDIVDAVESHTFLPLKRLQWRNADLRFTSVDALTASLNKMPDHPGLVRARDADDQLVLQALAADSALMDRARHPDRVRLLWDVCQVPDFRKSLTEQHSRLLAAIFKHLTDDHGRIPADWLNNQISRLERTDGDMDTLITRIANVRTWTYVSHRGEWVDDPTGWQERTRALEDKLSDALHERLTQRFVDRRTAVLVRRLKDNDLLDSAVAKDGDVLVEGHFVGRLDGFRFQADDAESGQAARAVASAAQRALRGEIASRVAQLAAEDDDAFSLDEQGIVLWRDAAVARLAAGADPLKPAVNLLPSDLVDPASRDALHRRLSSWLAGFLDRAARPLIRARDADLSGQARGIAYQLIESLGSLPRARVFSLLRDLTEADRKALARLDIRLGVESVFLPDMLKPAAMRLRALLWCTSRNRPVIDPPPPGRAAVPVTEDIPAAFYEAIGYRVISNAAVRADMLERFTAELRKLAHQGAFALPPDVMSLLGLTAEQWPDVMTALGYRTDSEGLYHSAPRHHRARPTERANTAHRKPKQGNTPRRDGASPATPTDGETASDTGQGEETATPTAEAKPTRSAKRRAARKRNRAEAAVQASVMPENQDNTAIDEGQSEATAVQATGTPAPDAKPSRSAKRRAARKRNRAEAAAQTAATSEDQSAAAADEGQNEATSAQATGTPAADAKPSRSAKRRAARKRNRAEAAAQAAATPETQSAAAADEGHSETTAAQATGTPATDAKPSRSAKRRAAHKRKLAEAAEGQGATQVTAADTDKPRKSPQHRPNRNRDGLSTADNAPSDRKTARQSSVRASGDEKKPHRPFAKSTAHGRPASTSRRKSEYPEDSPFAILRQLTFKS